MNYQMSGQKKQTPPRRSVERGAGAQQFQGHPSLLFDPQTAGGKRTQWGRWLKLALLGLLLGACTPVAEPAQPPPPSGPSSDPGKRAAERSLAPPGLSPPPSARNDWGLHTHQKIILRPQNLVLSLPQGALWKTQKRRGSWTGLRHDASDSEIWIRHVAARRTVTVEDCEAEARLGWTLIQHEEPSAVERRLAAPQGYGGRLRVVLLPDGGGRVEAFSVGVSRCLAVVFTTGNSPGFPERLRVAVNEVVETLRVPNISERGELRRF